MQSTASVLGSTGPAPRGAARVRRLTGSAMLSGVAFLLAFLEFSVPLSPSFAKMDLSDLPALLAAFAYGPISGVLVELVKNLLQLLTTSTGGVGELANFLMGCALVVPAGLAYRRHKTRRRAIWGCAAGSLTMGVTAAVVNYFVLLPLFSVFMPLDQVIAAFGEIFPFIQTKLDVCLLNALPVNLLKGALISMITMLLYKPLSPVLKGRNG